jgi:hypothetical protein
VLQGSLKENEEGDGRCAWGCEQVNEGVVGTELGEGRRSSSTIRSSSSIVSET